MPGLGSIAASLSTSIPSPGTITQQNPGQDFPAKVRFELFLKVETPVGTLHNEDAIILEATTDSIPPLVTPFAITAATPPAVIESEIASLGGVNVFAGTNLPVALLNDLGDTLASFTPQIHSTVLIGVCGDGIDSDVDGLIDEEEPNNIDDDGDGLIDEDSVCPPPVGGTTELLTDDSAAPAESTGSTGDYTLPIAAAAGGLLIALAGGGLYLRRRIVG